VLTVLRAFYLYMLWLKFRDQRCFCNVGFSLRRIHREKHVPKGCGFLSVDGGEVSSELELDPEHDRTDGEHQRLLEYGQVSG
jgi:hypothetical protein